MKKMAEENGKQSEDAGAGKVELRIVSPGLATDGGEKQSKRFPFNRLNFFMCYLWPTAKRFCLLVILPFILQIFVYSINVVEVLFATGDADQVERNGFGVFAHYKSVYSIINYITVWVWIVFIIASGIIFFRRLKGTLLSALLALIPLVIFIFTSTALHEFDEDILREFSIINFRVNECRFMERLNKVTGQYDEKIFTAVEQQFGKKEDFSSKGKLIIWSYGSLYGQIYLVVYDESDEVADPETKQRYIGYFCSPPMDPSLGKSQLGAYTCSLDGDYGRPVCFGFHPLHVMKLKSHFYFVRIDDPASHY